MQYYRYSSPRKVGAWNTSVANLIHGLRLQFANIMRHDWKIAYSVQSRTHFMIVEHIKINHKVKLHCETESMKFCTPIKLPNQC